MPRLDPGSWRVCARLLLAALVLVAGCDNLAPEDGADGIMGPEGPRGEDGIPGARGAVGAQGPAGLQGQPGEDALSYFDVLPIDRATAEQLGSATFEIVNVSQAAPPEVEFAVTDDAGRGIIGLNISRLRSFLVRLVPPSEAWDPVHWESLPHRISQFTDNQDGTYSALVERVIDRNPAPLDPGQYRLAVATTGLDFPRRNMIYDFNVATADQESRKIVTVSSCNECHGRLLMHGQFIDTRLCVGCHNPTGERVFTRQIHVRHLEGAALSHGIRYPQAITNCVKCHTAGDPETPEGDNWMTLPTIEGCGTCHSDVNFATGANHAGGVQLDNRFCSGCHGYGSDLPTDVQFAHAAPERTLQATITGVDVDDDPATGNGSVTVTFRVEEGGLPITNPAGFIDMRWTLAKLVRVEETASNRWQSYTGRTRSANHPGVAPVVVQGYYEDANDGTLAHVGNPDGTWTYTFALRTATPHGDIRSVDHLHDVDDDALVTPFSVEYDPSLTHRVAMEFKDALGTRNLSNAFFDFVPDGSPMVETRALVTSERCSSACHGDTLLHLGYTVEYCVTCHNQSTFDATTEADPMTLDLQRIVHKLHRGESLPSVVAGGEFRINGHAYDTVVFPQSITNCTVCHANAGWQSPTSRACATCHDAEEDLAHIRSNILVGQDAPSIDNEFSGDEVEACGVCHGEGRLFNVADVHQRAN